MPQMVQFQEEKVNSRFNAWFLLAPAAAALYMSQQEKNECEELSRAEKIRGNYENKIRFFSPPEKTFEIFAHQKTEEGELEMSFADFLEAVVPFNYCCLDRPTDEYMKNNDLKALNCLDADGSGTITFPEFIFFLTIV